MRDFPASGCNLAAGGTNVFYLETQSGGAKLSFAASVKGDDSVSVGELGPLGRFELHFESDDIVIKANRARHVLDHQHEFDRRDLHRHTSSGGSAKW